MLTVFEKLKVTHRVNNNKYFPAHKLGKICVVFKMQLPSAAGRVAPLPHATAGKFQTTSLWKAPALSLRLITLVEDKHKHHHPKNNFHYLPLHPPTPPSPPKERVLFISRRLLTT